MYIYALTIPSLLVVSLGLGFLKENWFLELGLAVVAASVAASMILAFRNGLKAKQAEVVEFESYLPEVDESESHTFKFAANIMGVNTHDPISHLQKQIDEIKKVAWQDEKNFRFALRITDQRVGICFAQLRYHEEVTLMKVLGEGAGAIVLAGVLTIIGSAYLAFPVVFYDGFTSVASFLKGVAQV